MRSPPPVASEPLDISFESDALSVLERNFAVHGDAFRMFSPVLQRPIWVLSHPDHVRHVLVDRSANFTKGIGIDRVAILLGLGADVQPVAPGTDDAIERAGVGKPMRQCEVRIAGRSP